MLEKVGGIFEESRVDGGGRGGGDVDFRGTRLYDDVEGGGESLLFVVSVGMGVVMEWCGEMGLRLGLYLEMAELDVAGSSGRSGDGAFALFNSVVGVLVV